MIQFLKSFLLKSIIVLLFGGIAYGQNTDSLIAYPNSDKIEVIINAEINKNEEKFEYNYLLENSVLSEQNIYSFLLEISPNVHSLKSPNLWGGNISNVRKKVVSWGSRDTLADLKPSELLSGFSFISEGLPGIFDYFIRGFVEIEPVAYGQAPPLSMTTGSDIFENSVNGLTISPWIPDPSISLISFTDTLETFRHRSCEELEWVTDAGVCIELEDGLSEVKANLQAGDSLSAANALKRVIDLVEAEKETSLTSEGYALLYFNAQYLGEKLPEPKDY